MSNKVRGYLRLSGSHDVLLVVRCVSSPSVVCGLYFFTPLLQLKPHTQEDASEATLLLLEAVLSVAEKEAVSDGDPCC